jgi:hypothetical protein
MIYIVCSAVSTFIRLKYLSTPTGDHTDQRMINYQTWKLTSLKRERFGSPQDGRQSSKRQRLTFNKDDMDWLKDELRDIKFEIGEIRTSLIEIADHLRGDVDLKLEEIVCRLEQL